MQHLDEPRSVSYSKGMTNYSIRRHPGNCPCDTCVWTFGPPMDYSEDIKTTPKAKGSHANCDHPSTKTARSACRKEKG